MRSILFLLTAYFSISARAKWTPHPDITLPDGQEESDPELAEFEQVAEAELNEFDIAAASTLWQPAVGANWQIILNSTLQINSSTILVPENVKIYEVDLWDTPKSIFDELHRRDIKVICYFSAGTSEDWRSDFAQFSATDKGSCLPMWVGERYVNIRSSGVWDVMKQRIKLASEKGCDAIDPDNIDIYSNSAGFTPAITKKDTVMYFKNLAKEAHYYGMSIGLKNAQSILKSVIKDIQFAVNEECSSSFLERDCNKYKDLLSPSRPFGSFRTPRGKPVFHIEYTEDSKAGGPVKRDLAEPKTAEATKRRQCLERNSLGRLFSTTIKSMNLDGWVMYCDGKTATTEIVHGRIVKGKAGECSGKGTKAMVQDSESRRPVVIV